MQGTTVVTAAMAAGTVAPDSRAPSNDDRGRDWIAWAPLALLPLLAIAFRSVLTSWGFMWLIAGTIFAGCKWQTWYHARHAFMSNWRRSSAYLLLWPGMDAGQFLNPAWTKRSVRPREWFAALLKTYTGAALILGAGSALLARHPLLSGWIGMIGIVLILHFGMFCLIALAWQSGGVHAEPIMRDPLRSESLGDLWGRRWNLGFRDLSHKLVFRPLHKRHGAVTATLAVFLISGLVHELVISVPAGTGYGLPTAYFLIQGFGVITERSQAGKRLGLSCGIKGRLWTAFVALGPIFLLFRPAFVLRVIVPFLHAI
jgi:hypothetical protein